MRTLQQTVSVLQRLERKYGELYTDYWMKPIPLRCGDWAAWFDGSEELHTAHGATEAEAIDELITWYLDMYDEGEEYPQ